MRSLVRGREDEAGRGRSRKDEVGRVEREKAS